MELCKKAKDHIENLILHTLQLHSYSTTSLDALRHNVMTSQYSTALQHPVGFAKQIKPQQSHIVLHVNKGILQAKCSAQMEKKTKMWTLYQKILTISQD